MDRAMINLAISGSNKDFDLVIKSSGDHFSHNDLSKLKKGDLILRRVLSPGKKIFHAGIYCGENEVIQFTSTAVPTLASCSSSLPFASSQVSSQLKGLVDKISLKKFIFGQGFKVLRLKDGPPINISQKISDAMDDEQEYHLMTNNCLHFALRVLEVSPGPMQESPPQDTGVDISMEDTTPLANYQEKN